MILFHGSFCSIDHIDINKCMSHTDFGQGFYLTPYEDHAKSRAAQKAAEAGTQPVVNRFKFNEKTLYSGKYKVKLFRFKAGLITLSELSRNLTYRDDSIQYCFCTEKSTKLLKKL